MSRYVSSGLPLFLPMSVLLAASSIAPSGCSNSVSSSLHAGDTCPLDKLNAKVCGTGEGGKTVVLVCAKGEDEMLTWKVKDWCATDCKAAKCVSPFEEGMECDSPWAKVCGSGEGGKSAVLACSEGEGEKFFWKVQTWCDGDCEGAVCVGAGPGDATGDLETVDQDKLDFDYHGGDFWWDGGGCKEYLTPCASDSECCDPGLCVLGPEGRVCTKNCIDDCAPGWECKQLWGADVMFICVAKLDNLCKKPCFEDTDCNVINDMCLPIGSGGAKMCSRSCVQEMCPAEYDCQEMKDAKGDTTMQCIPLAGACECVGMDVEEYQSDVKNCGECGVVCKYDNAKPVCSEGDCQMGACEPGWSNLNKEDSDGCEYQCQAAVEPDKPDLEGNDTNCDGIDGDAAHAIFVSPAGMDIGNQTGDMEHPVKTISKGIALAAAKKWDVYVAQGIYEEQVLLADGTSMYGGFNPEAGWAHDPKLYVTTIQWKQVGPGGVVTLVADGITVLTAIEGFNIEAGNNDQSGGASVAVHVKGGTDKLRFSHNTVLSGNGGTASVGNDGQPGKDGEAGENGNIGCEYDGCWICMGCSGCSLPLSGGGGKGHCGNSGGSGGQGGEAHKGGNSGKNSEDATPGGNGAGGAKQDGAGGTNGMPGNEGQQGGGGDGSGVLNEGSFWVASSGTPGTDGSKGAGGGGGGGGGGDGDDSVFGWECFTYGASGGGGGGGGCQGTAGTGGGGGGGSFGFLVVNSTCIIEDNVIAFRYGGNGGNGGKGGTGGKGGG
ncbi:MAG: hypothetical protein FJ109_12670, partial [Deltaproteobacteria bacterium]|nr:hypothetical protein [Deltaproteobacteria bacterium]